MELSKIPCRFCHVINLRNAEICKACGESLGPVNVNILSDPYFKEGLLDRLKGVMSEIQRNGKQTEADDFEVEIASEGQAVINMDMKFLFKLVNENEEYLSYQRAVEQHKRTIMSFQNDLRRCVVETSFYGFTGKNLVYAALSVDNNGVRSYGDVSVALITAQISQRTTVFEKNTYPLYDELTGSGWRAGTIMPSGYSGVWEDKAVVALIKHGLQIATAKNKLNIAQVILHSDGKRHHDEFIELHIYNRVTSHTFAKVTFHKRPRSLFDNEQLQVFLDVLENQDVELTGL
ncbi:MAG: hypothetical protein R2791_15380 [Saprospiraceae bacterium]